MVERNRKKTLDLLKYIFEQIQAILFIKKIAGQTQSYVIIHVPKMVASKTVMVDKSYYFELKFLCKK